MIRKLLYPTRGRALVRNSLLLALVILLILIPRLNATTSEEINGSIILWHTWSGSELDSLDSSISSFETLNTGVKVIASQYEVTELFAQFEQSASLGFGPDLVLAPQSFLRSFKDVNLIAEFPSEITAEVNYYSDALLSVQQQENILGLPISLYTHMLFYNKEHIETPVTNLEALTSDFESNKTFGVGSSYKDLIWGVGALGGQLFNASGESDITSDAMAQWLMWLQSQQELPQFYLDENKEILRELFRNGKLSYLVDSSRQLANFTNHLGDSLGVTTLPANQGFEASPLLESDILYVSQSASIQQQEQALDFALFLSNREQQRRLLREARHVPVNQDVNIDSRLNPVVYIISEQISHSIPVKADETYAVLETFANDYFRQVLEGVLSADKAVVALNQRLQEFKDSN